MFNTPDQNGLDLAALARVAPEQWEQLVFQLPQASALLESAYPVDRIWAANQPDATEPEAIDLDEGGATLFIWREGVNTRIERRCCRKWWLAAGWVGLSWGTAGLKIGGYGSCFVDVTLQIRSWQRHGHS
ncbi:MULTISPECIES: hypothetical protein [Synechococcales]|uniref:hypothetical protein n=1 Tax=Synechococcus sp. CS-1325 TaxID=2847979 RepID=UPI00223BF9F3|nr:hypothetical protein [Synechococcus sp. CS-1325]